MYFLMMGAEMASEENIEKFNVEKSMDGDVLHENLEGEQFLLFNETGNSYNNDGETKQSFKELSLFLVSPLSESELQGSCLIQN